MQPLLLFYLGSLLGLRIIYFHTSSEGSKVADEAKVGSTNCWEAQMGSKVPEGAAVTESFNSKSLALQAQKKILTKMATKAVANMLIDDTSSDILDELYKVTREYTNDKKEAHKVLKDLIKIALKIGILYRNNQFNQDEVEIVDKFKKKLNQAAMTAVSFYEVEFTFDRNVLAELLNKCKDLLHKLIERHLTPKSHGRIDHVFRLFADVEFLSDVYNPNGTYKESLQKICHGVNKLLDEGII